jgi:hypothetical protein
MGTGGMTTLPAGSSQQGARDEDKTFPTDASIANEYVSDFVNIYCQMRETQTVNGPMSTFLPFNINESCTNSPSYLLLGI